MGCAFCTADFLEPTPSLHRTVTGLCSSVISQVKPSGGGHKLKRSPTGEHRSIFSSDPSLGTPGRRADPISSVLEWNTADRIDLAGDIFDLWDPPVTRWGNTHGRIVDRLREKAALGARLVYLAGNHDRTVLGPGACDAGASLSVMPKWP